MKKVFLVISIVFIAISFLAQDVFYLYKKNSPATYFEISKVDSISLVHPKTTAIRNGHQWVDLGLPSRVKWATCNVGADSPEGYGNYFSWGEISTKYNYNWSYYKWNNGSSSTDMTKYCASNNYGTKDDKKTLELSDDVVRSEWGSNWRMPTSKEIKELCTECIWTWTSNYNGTGVAGMIVSSKNYYNTPHIFFPAAGYIDGTTKKEVGSVGKYWSSSLYFYSSSYSSNSAINLKISSGGENTNDEERRLGFTIRGVCP